MSGGSLDTSAVGWINGCSGKIAYTTRRLAIDASQGARRKGATWHVCTETYRCRHCNLWHNSTRGKIGPGQTGRTTMDSNEAATRQHSAVGPHWIVVAHPPLLTPGRPKPYRRHETRDAAEREAARLAGKVPGKEFAVYERVAVVSVAAAAETVDV